VSLFGWYGYGSDIIGIGLNSGWVNATGLPMRGKLPSHEEGIIYKYQCITLTSCDIIALMKSSTEKINDDVIALQKK
jgi:hypothetical protein